MDFHETSLGFLERQQTKSLYCYEELLEVSHKLLKPGGLMVIHVGSGGRKDLAIGIRELAANIFVTLGEIVENVEDIEQHGISDKGLTRRHHLLFLQTV